MRAMDICAFLWVAFLVVWLIWATAQSDAAT